MWKPAKAFDDVIMRFDKRIVCGKQRQGTFLIGYSLTEPTYNLDILMQGLLFLLIYTSDTGK
jgi:hypothetical protein